MIDKFKEILFYFTSLVGIGVTLLSIYLLTKIDGKLGFLYKGLNEIDPELVNKKIPNYSIVSYFKDWTCQIYEWRYVFVGILFLFICLLIAYSSMYIFRRRITKRKDIKTNCSLPNTPTAL